MVDLIERAALRYLARRPRTIAHMKAYLARIGASPGGVRAAIAKFQRLGYLDDDAYARRWARDRLARKPMGRERLEHELGTHGLEAHTIAVTVEELYGETSERDLALKLAGSRAVTPSFLRRRGFSEETIESVMSQER
ncbi:MAG TPA: regulatory protein RecX [Nitrospiraceae bacterium]|nr:regulatory protein RecX [Nitrospiraceae bacterium]